MEDAIRDQLRPGVRVRVTQQIAARDYTWTSETTGTILEYRQKQTGSWYAHSKGDKLWLDRLLIQKADGERTTLNLDEYSHIDVLGAGAAEPNATGPDQAAKRNESDLPV